MPAMSSEMLTAIKSSLTNVSHEWASAALMSEEHLFQRITAPGGVVSVTDEIHASDVYQMQSDSLELVLIFHVETIDGALEIITLNYLGNNWTTADAPLHALLTAFGTAGLVSAEDALLEILT